MQAAQAKQSKEREASETKLNKQSKHINATQTHQMLYATDAKCQMFDAINANMSNARRNRRKNDKYITSDKQVYFLLGLQ